jgi:hypothetical protein
MTRIILQAGSGFARDTLMARCEANVLLNRAIGDEKNRPTA